MSARRNGAGGTSGPFITRERIERLYRAHPRGFAAKPHRKGPPDEYGLDWFARQLGVHWRTVLRWQQGVQRPRPREAESILRDIERLEREAGIEPERDPLTG
ncbi:MAG TPA: hypothetical protein VF158_04240 [Longimicrobiales bacterium]